MATSFYRKNGSLYNAQNNAYIGSTAFGNGAGYNEVAAPNNPAIPTGMTAIPGGQASNYNVMGQFGQTGQAGSGLYGTLKVPTSLNQGDVSSGTNVNPAPYNPFDVSTEGNMAWNKQALADQEAAKLELQKVQEQKTNSNTRLDELYKTLGLKGQDYQQQLDNLGVTANTNTLQDLNKQIAAANADFTKAIGRTENQGRGITTGIIGGQQNFLQRQQASEVGALTSMAQAVQGNIELAYTTADKAIALKYDPVVNEINQTKDQLTSIYNDLTIAEKKKADAQQTVLDERLRLITDQKKTEGDIQALVLSALENGADMNTANAMRKAKTMEEAINLSNNFLSGEKKIIADYMSKYSDAGITMKDTMEQATAKLKNSKIYKEQVRGPVGNGSTTTDAKSLQTDVKKAIENLSGGGDWVANWNLIRGTYPESDYPNITNDVIDQLLQKSLLDPNAQKNTNQSSGGGLLNGVTNWWSKVSSNKAAGKSALAK